MGNRSPNILDFVAGSTYDCFFAKKLKGDLVRGINRLGIKGFGIKGEKNEGKNPIVSGRLSDASLFALFTRLCVYIGGDIAALEAIVLIIGGDIAALEAIVLIIGAALTIGLTEGTKDLRGATGPAPGKRSPKIIP